MKKPQIASVVYLILEPNFAWHGKKHAVGALVELAPTCKEDERKLKLYLSRGGLRVPTDADGAEAATPAAQALPPPVPIPKPKQRPVSSDPAPPIPQTVSAALVYAPGPVATFVTNPTAAANQVQPVPLALIRPDPTQPRKDFADEAMQELAASIEQLGVEMAIRVRPMSRWRQIVSFVARQRAKRERKEEGYGIAAVFMQADGIEASVREELSADGWMGRLVAEGRVEKRDPQSVGYVPAAGALAPLTGATSLPGEEEWLEIVYGERRWRACQAAGLTTIPAKVRELTDLDAGELQAVENLDRAALKPVEEAAQFHKLLYRTAGYTMDRLEAVTGIKRPTIYSKLKLLDLPDEPRQFLDAGKLGSVTAQRIGRLKNDPQVQARAIELILHPEDDDDEVLSDRDAQIAIEQAEQEIASQRAEAAIKEDAVKRGLIWLEGKDRERVFGGYHHPRRESGLSALDEQAEGDPEYRSYNQILAKKPGRAAAKVIKPTTATIRRGELLELFETLELRKALIEAGVDFATRRQPADPAEAKRRAKDKMMKTVLARAGKHINLRAQALVPRAMQTPETRGMWLALARSAVRLASNDDLRYFVKRHGLTPLTKVYGGGKPQPMFAETVRAYIDASERGWSDIAGVASELLLTAGAWWSQNDDFGDNFRAGASAFGVDLKRLKEEGGGVEDEPSHPLADEDEGEDKDSVSAHTEETEASVR